MKLFLECVLSGTNYGFTLVDLFDVNFSQQNLSLYLTSILNLNLHLRRHCHAAVQLGRSTLIVPLASLNTEETVEMRSTILRAVWLPCVSQVTQDFCAFYCRDGPFGRTLLALTPVADTRKIARFLLAEDHRCQKWWPLLAITAYEFFF